VSNYKVTGEVWRHPGAAGWHFVTLPEEIADPIRARYAGAHRRFGSLPVRATLAATTWTTSVFADTRSSSYLLPIKAEVRRRENVGDGDTVTVALELDV
jgi:hypothetical protein